MTIPWHNPLPYRLVVSADSQSFQTMRDGETALPLPPHVGAYGVIRRHHVHEGVDLYCPAHTPVMAVEDGVIVAILPFTGEKAQSPWWLDTDALLIEGKTGVIVYGEVDISPTLKIGDKVQRGQIIARVKTVLKTDKGRPLTMLHLECHRHGTRDVFEWKTLDHKPPSLQDPTPWLIPLTHF